MRDLLKKVQNASYFKIDYPKHLNLLTMSEQVSDGKGQLLEVRRVWLNAFLYISIIICDTLVAATLVGSIKAMALLVDPDLMVWRARLHDIVYYLEVAVFLTYLAMSTVKVLIRLAKSTREPI